MRTAAPQVRGGTRWGCGVEAGAGEAAPFLGCPGICGVLSLRDCLWLHLLVSILLGSRRDHKP